LLAVVLDCNPYTWGLRLSTHEQQEQQLSFTKALNDLQIFLNAFMALNPDNSLVVVGAGIKTRSVIAAAVGLDLDRSLAHSRSLRLGLVRYCVKNHRYHKTQEYLIRLVGV